MDEPQSQNQLQDEEPPRRISGNWRSCLLLSVMLLGLVATPLAIFYRWNADRPEVRLPSIAGREDIVNRIAFITADHQVATMAPDGSDVQRLTNMNRRFEFPAWAPDGSRLAVVGGESIYLIRESDQSSDQDRLTQVYENPDEPPFYLFWSPDSRYVSFLANHPDGIALHLVEPEKETSEDQALAVGQPFYWDWTPAADRLFIHSGNSGANARLEMIDPLGQSANASFGDPGYFQAPGVSMSGHYQAFAELDDEGRSRLVIQDDDGGRRVFETHFGQMAMTWSPAAELLAYTSPRINARLGGGPLRLLDPGTKESSLLSKKNVLAFFWSPDGQTIAYFTLPENDDSNVRIAEVGNDRRLMARPRRQSIELRLELWAVDVANGHQRRLALFAPTSQFLRQFLPYFDQYSLSHRIWSPDSDALVLPMIEDGRSQIAVIPLSRGATRLIGDGEFAFWSHQ